MKNEYDVVIAGSGPSGAAAAKGLVNEGLSVLVLEKKRLPRYKICSGIIFKKSLDITEKYFGGVIVSIGLILFAISTAISWSYYGNRCVEYLFGSKAILPYRWIYVIALFVGAVVRLEFVWNFSDITLGLMAIPNLIAIIALSSVVISLTKDYFSRKHVRTN